MKKIVIILPPREGFSPTHFGAISLCVRDFVEHSRYRDRSLVVGGVATDPPFPGIAYRALTPKRHWWQRRSRAYAEACLALLHENSPALVEIHNRPALAHILCKRWPGKIALHLHNDPQEMKGATTPGQRQWLLEHCASIYCVSGYISDRFIEGVKGDTSRVQIVYNGLRLPPAKTLPARKKQIIFVGRFKPEKGVLEFAEALTILLPKYPDWRGVFIGAVRHQPNSPASAYEKRVHALLEPLGDQIESRGFCNYEETIQATAESTIAVVPSTWHEAFGRTALEAMGCGCIVISSTRGGLKEVIDNAAIPLEEISAATIAHALEQVMLAPSLWPEMQGKALIQAQNFDIARCTQKLDAIRERLLATCRD